ncbi:hypothetical protein KAU09_03075 [Candidatus Parcubacteria bacterium]|nr:hypothetical protein [Candidatus Parcubacteria bacterium]
MYTENKKEHIYCHKCGGGDFDEREVKNQEGQVVAIETRCTCGELIESEKA